MKEIIRCFIDEFIIQIKSIKSDGIKKQIPNILTFSRALAPFIVIPTILLDNNKLAICELILFTTTDFFDGKLARKFNYTSEFGSRLDAVCDKIFVLGIILPIISKYPIFLINLILEGCISYINILSELKKIKAKSNIIGKIKTVFLSTTVIMGYASTLNYIYILVFSITTLIFQIIAFCKYLKYYVIRNKI